MLDERNAKLLQDHWENERVGNSDAFNKAKNKGYISLKSSKGSIVPSIVLLNSDGTLKKDDMGRLAIATRPSLVSTLNSKPVDTPTNTIEQKKQNSQTAPASFFASHIPGKHEHDYEDMQNNVALNLPLNTPRKQGLLLEDHAKGQKAYNEGLDPYTAMVHTVLHESDQEKRRQMLSAMNRKFEKQLDKNIKPGVTVRDFLVMLTDRKRNELAKKFKDHVIAYKAKHKGKSTETPDKVRMGPVWDKIKKAASSIWGKIKGWDEKVSNPAGVPDNDEKPRPTSPTAKAPIKRDTSTYSSLHPLEASEHHDILAPAAESLFKTRALPRGAINIPYSSLSEHIHPEHRKELDKIYGNSIFDTNEHGSIIGHRNKDYNDKLTKILDKLGLHENILTKRQPGEKPEDLIKRSLAYGTHDVPSEHLKNHPEYYAHHRDRINAFSKGYGVRPETARQILAESAEGNHSFKKAALIRALLHRQKGEDIGHLGEYIRKESHKTPEAQIAHKLQTLRDVAAHEGFTRSVLKAAKDFGRTSDSKSIGDVLTKSSSNPIFGKYTHIGAALSGLGHHRMQDVIDYIKGIKKDKNGKVISTGTNIHDVRRRLENLNNIGQGMGYEKDYLDSVDARRKTLADDSQEARVLDALKARILGSTPASRNAFFRHHGKDPSKLLSNVNAYFNNERNTIMNKGQDKQSGSPGLEQQPTQTTQPKTSPPQEKPIIEKIGDKLRPENSVQGTPTRRKAEVGGSQSWQRNKDADFLDLDPDKLHVLAGSSKDIPNEHRASLMNILKNGGMPGLKALIDSKDPNYEGLKKSANKLIDLSQGGSENKKHLERLNTVIQQVSNKRQPIEIPQKEDTRNYIDGKHPLVDSHLRAIEAYIRNAKGTPDEKMYSNMRDTIQGMDKDKLNKLYQGFADVARTVNTPEHRVRPEVLATEALRVHHLAGQGDREGAGKLAKYLVGTYGEGIIPLIKGLVPEKKEVESSPQQQTAPNPQEKTTPKVDPKASPEQQKRQEIAQEAKEEKPKENETSSVEKLRQVTANDRILHKLTKGRSPKHVEIIQSMIAGGSSLDEIRKINKNEKLGLTPEEETNIDLLVRNKAEPQEGGQKKNEPSSQQTSKIDLSKIESDTNKYAYDSPTVRKILGITDKELEAINMRKTSEEAPLPKRDTLANINKYLLELHKGTRIPEHLSPEQKHEYALKHNVEVHGLAAAHLNIPDMPGISGQVRYILGQLSKQGKLQKINQIKENNTLYRRFKYKDLYEVAKKAQVLWDKLSDEQKKRKIEEFKYK